MPDPVRVLIVDDHAVVRDGLALLIDSASDLAVVGRASDAETAVSGAAASTPDVVMMDVGLPDAAGYTVIGHILSAVPSAVVLMLSMSDDTATLAACLRAGASGYLLKESSGADVLAAIRAAAAGQLVFSPGVSDVVRGLLGHDALARQRSYSALTDREYDVLRLLAEGATIDAVSAQLGISDKTVRNTVSRILTKLRVATREQAVRHARGHGLGRGE